MKRGIVIGAVVLLAAMIVGVISMALSVIVEALNNG